MTEKTDQIPPSEHAKHVTSGTENRLERLPRRCRWCRTPLPVKSRSDRKYCDGHCRRMAHVDRAHEGRVASVRRLKSGRMSVIVHMPDCGLKPGDLVHVAKGDNDD